MKEKKKEIIEEKKEVSIDDLNVVGKLSPSQYWEWRCSLEEITSAKHAATITQLKLKTLELELENYKLKCELFKYSVQSAQQNAAKVEADYQTYRSNLEKELGFSLTNCTVDEFNYAVRKL